MNPAASDPSKRLKIKAVALAAAFFLLCGFVPATEKVLSWCKKSTPVIRHPVKIAFNDRQGRLNVGAPGRHSIVFDDGGRLEDPGIPDPDAADAALSAPTPGKMDALWRFLDFYSPSRPDSLVDLLLAAGVDPDRRGWVRPPDRGDELIVTIGASGESEPLHPQAWFERVKGRMTRLLAPGGSIAEAGPFGPDGLPEWIAFDGGGKLRILSQDAQGKKK